eukprot:COSAG02_NODE_373_length_23594_cov_6.892190_2_plen_77_part_00
MFNNTYSLTNYEVSNASSESSVVVVVVGWSMAFCLSFHFFTQARSLLKYRGHSCIPKHGPYCHFYEPTVSCNRKMR